MDTLAVILEHRFNRTPDGRVWTSASFGDEFWARYRRVFGRVEIVARVRDVDEAAPNERPITVDGVSVRPIPYYVGPLGFALSIRKIIAAVKEVVLGETAVILRVPGMLGHVAYKVLREHSRPFAAEVVGDPYDVFAPGAVRHPLRPIFRRLFANSLRNVCAHAAACSYVTERTLQRRYPAASGSFTTHYSSVQLGDEAFVDPPRTVGGGGPLRVLTAGSLAQLYKGTDILIRSVGRARSMGADVSLRIAGDGRHRRELEVLVEQEGLGDHVAFLGQLPGSAAVRTEMDRADLFALPSRTEGLPRAVIEAMARGLPCVASTAGGIPELLPREWLVPPEDVDSLANLLVRLAAEPRTLASMSQRNLDAASAYRADVLQQRRDALYSFIKEASAAAATPATARDH